MALVDASGKELYTCQVNWPGTIGLEEKGSNGFGFDPLFYPDGLNETAAQLSSSHKNKISHRGQAWIKMLSGLKQVLREENSGSSRETANS